MKIVNDLPTRNREIVLSELQRLAALGFTLDQIAKIMDMGDATLWEKINKHPEVKRAWETGKAQGWEKIAKTAFDTAMEGDTTMLIFLCKVKLGWSEKREESDDTPRVHVYIPETLNVEEWNERVTNSKTLPEEENGSD